MTAAPAPPELSSAFACGSQLRADDASGWLTLNDSHPGDFLYAGMHNSYIVAKKEWICAGNGEQLFPFSVNIHINTSKTMQIRGQITEKHGVTLVSTGYATLPHVSSAITRFSALMLPSAFLERVKAEAYSLLDGDDQAKRQLNLSFIKIDRTAESQCIPNRSDCTFQLCTLM